MRRLMYSCCAIFLAGPLWAECYHLAEDQGCDPYGNHADDVFNWCPIGVAQDANGMWDCDGGDGTYYSKREDWDHSNATLEGFNPNRPSFAPDWAANIFESPEIFNQCTEEGLCSVEEHDPVFPGDGLSYTCDAIMDTRASKTKAYPA